MKTDKDISQDMVIKQLFQFCSSFVLLHCILFSFSFFLFLQNNVIEEEHLNVVERDNGLRQKQATFYLFLRRGRQGLQLIVEKASQVTCM